MVDEYVECNSSSADAAQEINELRGKLDRRNALLNVVRKAYHRDVLAVKECLIDAERQYSIVHENNPDSSFALALHSVPSIDLRETFRLFAPHECELRIRPCWSCGGTLEVIHRESARIVEFKHSIQLLWEREKLLCEELIGVKVTAQEDRWHLDDVAKRNQDERMTLLEQISSLKQQVADRHALDVEVKRLREEVRNLKAMLKQQEPVLLDRERLLAEVEQMRGNAEQDEKKFNEQVEQTLQLQHANDSQSSLLLVLGQENEQLKLNLLASRQQCTKADDECSLLRLEISRREVETSNIEACFKTAVTTMDDRRHKFEQVEGLMKCTISDLELECSTLEATISRLDEKLNMTFADAEFYRMGIEAVLEDAKRRGLIPCVPLQSTLALTKVGELIIESHHLLRKSDMLFNQLLGCIRSMYESCLTQERLLCDYGSELFKNDQKLKSSDTANDKARNVLDHLTNADDSSTIAWESMLTDETDRRHIMGNLQNRLQMGQFSLDKAFQKIRERHELETRTYRNELDLELTNRRAVERDLTDAVTLNRQYEKKIAEVQQMKTVIQRTVDSLRADLHHLRNECLCNDTVSVMLKDGYQRIRTLANKLIDEVDASKRETCDHKVHLAEKEADISMRDAAILDMEALLEKITHRYAEKERLRMKVHADVGVQAAPAVADATVHADFLPAVMRRAQPTVSDNKKADDALLPGRIINVPDENWPSRINIGPMQSGLQFRRALDKL